VFQRRRPGVMQGLSGASIQWSLVAIVYDQINRSVTLCMDGETVTVPNSADAAGGLFLGAPTR
jgi:hypothetical protein